MHNYHKYLSVTELEKEWGFYITTVGYTKINPNEGYPKVKEHPSSHIFAWDKGRILNGYYLVYISQGKGLFESDKTRPSIVNEGSCFFLFPNIWHRYKPDPNLGWEEYWVGFKGSYSDNFMNKSFFNPVTPSIDISLNESALLLLFQRLVETVKAAQPGYTQIISGITLELLATVYNSSIYRKQSENPTQQLIEKAIFLLRESLSERVNMQELAQKLPMGYSKFRKEFKKSTDQSPLEYLLNLRLNRSKDLLKSTTLNINEIAYQTGFESAFYFSKLFKSKIGISPTTYRLGKL